MSAFRISAACSPVPSPSKATALSRHRSISGFRIGGAVEFGGLEAPPNHARTKRLYDKAATMIEGLPAFESGRLWMGFRPSLPDSLPVIGTASRNPHVFHAFGHGHYGMTQSHATAGLVAALVAGRKPAIDLSPFSPRRF
ncbi:D-amino-acid dehydrogenase OS=Bosea thiooxidans OX=53254 GN=ARD30_12655 PE=4 SV=1 [Bosea thiooxidans]